MHTDEILSIGATRLSVIDVEGGHQPVSNEDETVWAAQNGEIFNYGRLRGDLIRRGHTLSSRVDTEVIVHLYEEYGVDCVHALEGMFAFALWDARRRLLMICRDRFGEKPLFYSQSGEGLAFASELTALAAAAPGLEELDPEAVDDYFVYGYVPGRRSISKGARQLLPGHRLIWRPGEEVREEPYWRSPEALNETSESIEELTAEFGRLLSDSVAARMVADVPVGVFLSGGLDSTLIAAIAAEQTGGRIETFTVGYDVGDVSETAAARATAAEIGSRHHELILPLDAVGERVGRVLSGLDQPIADQALPAFHAVAEFARERVTVAVGGEGADELFAGYPRYRWLQRAAAVEERTPAPLAAAAAGALGAIPTGRTDRLSNVLRPTGEMGRQLDWIGLTSMRERFYGRRLLADLRPTSELVAELGSYALDAPDPTARLMLLDQRHWLPGDVLAKADRASMQVSLEVRTPFLNYFLAEFASTVPAAVHLAGGGKQLLRALLREVLPDSELKRRKTGFRVPVREWLSGPLLPLLEDQARVGSVVTEGWIDGDRIRRLVGAHASAADGPVSSNVLWRFLAFGLWLDRFRGREADV